MTRLSWLRLFCSTLAVLTFGREQYALAFTSGMQHTNHRNNPVVDRRVTIDSRMSWMISTRQVTYLSSSASSKQSSRTKLSLWSRDEEITGADKIKACVPYLLPLLDGEMFGKYMYERVPPLGFLDSLFIGPLYDFYSQVPLLGLILFLVLTLGTRGNTEMNRAVRFNAQQAALIDVLLVFPELIGSAFEGEDIPRYLVEPCMNFVWYTYMAMVLYSIYTNLQGKKPDQIPWISGYAELMVGPF